MMFRKRKTDIVLVWKFDRYARSTKELVNALEEFNRLGVDFISFKESLDTSSPAGRVLFHIISAFSSFEAEIIRERVVAGMEKAKARGVKMGRPCINSEIISGVKKMHQLGYSRKEIISKFNIAKSTYHSILTR
ncbi:MAG: recombinase family protein [Ignavibacteriales bacterium]|nr:recombinase family protein [Ignavibacteriales bacterium]